MNEDVISVLAVGSMVLGFTIGFLIYYLCTIFGGN